MAKSATAACQAEGIEITATETYAAEVPDGEEPGKRIEEALKKLCSSGGEPEAGPTQEVRPTVGRRPPEDSIPTTATGSRPPGGTGSRRGSAAFFFTDCSFLNSY